MSQNLLSRYGGSAPRYTSYPTAPHFHDGVGHGIYQRWLASITREDRLSLYLHVPFCEKMCWYCGCQTKIVQQSKPVSNYARHLGQEIELVSKQIKYRPNVTHIHWGGGTPTLLDSDTFLTLMNRLRTQFTFANDAEIAIEIDPRTMTRDKAENLAAAGVNRASLGIQDFNAHVQQAINRIQSFEQTKKVIDWLRNAGIQQISLDLMYGLPRQTVHDAIRTVDLTMALQADRFSIFGYAHVPWMKKHQNQIKSDDIPTTQERAEQATAIADRLLHHGYVSIGLDHYAKPEDSMAQALRHGTLRRNFQGYTTDTAPTLIGLGASSIGGLKQGYVQNHASVRQYSAAIDRAELPVARGFELKPSDIVRRDIIERLMCDYTIDLNSKIEQSDETIANFASEFERLAEMHADGLLILKEGKLEITPDGRPFVRAICAVFDQYLMSGVGRYSMAV